MTEELDFKIKKVEKAFTAYVASVREMDGLFNSDFVRPVTPMGRYIREWREGVESMAQMSVKIRSYLESNKIK